MITDISNLKGELADLLKDKTYLQIPKVGDLVKGIIIYISKSEIIIDIPGFRTGTVRGNEFYAESEEFSGLKVGEEVEATVVDLENENGDVELSFRFAGQQKTWEILKQYKISEEKVSVKVCEANKGGLIIKLLGVQGFLPVSQLSPDNYPRVQGGDKSKILERLRSLVGKNVEVRVLDALQEENKLIVSEKSIWEEDKKEHISQYKVGDIVDGEATAVTDFGVFVRFGELEGLIHISELAWQRIDHPQDLYKVGDTIKAAIVNIQGSRIFLSTKKLQDDPWIDIAKKYKAGDKVTGKVLKVNPFGLFVELDKEIHGLAHISEMGKYKPEDIKQNSEMEFIVISIEPNEHRLGLSLKDKAELKKEENKKEVKKKIVKSKEEKVEEVNVEDNKVEEKVEEAKAEEIPVENKTESSETEVKE